MLTKVVRSPVENPNNCDEVRHVGRETKMWRARGECKKRAQEAGAGHKFSFGCPWLGQDDICFKMPHEKKYQESRSFLNLHVVSAIACGRT